MHLTKGNRATAKGTVMKWPLLFFASNERSPFCDSRYVLVRVMNAPCFLTGMRKMTFTLSVAPMQLRFISNMGSPATVPHRSAALK